MIIATNSTDVYAYGPDGDGKYGAGIFLQGGRTLVSSESVYGSMVEAESALKDVVVSCVKLGQEEGWFKDPIGHTLKKVQENED